MAVEKNQSEFNYNDEHWTRQENQPGFIKKCVVFTACGATLILVVALCIMLYKNKFSVESLISLLLAFFSIFISVFFYFKADEASARFYDTSYSFMKDASVMLGKIDVRFDEKLNNLNDKINRFTAAKVETAEELETAEDERDKIIDDLMNKAKVSDEEKKKYLDAINEKNRQIKELNLQIRRLQELEHRGEMGKSIKNDYLSTRAYDDVFKKIEEMTARYAVRAELAKGCSMEESKAVKAIDSLSDIEKRMLLTQKPNEWPCYLREQLEEVGVVDANGTITPMGKKLINILLK